MWRFLGCSLLVGLAAVVGRTGPVKPLSAGETPPGGDSGSHFAPEFVYKGTGTCSAAACHGGPGTPGSRGSEYTTWVARDPHARAYQVLFNECSQRIAGNLSAGRGTPPESNRLCLDCHVHPLVETSKHDVSFSLSDGVGCESCHGPSQQWLAAHTSAEWIPLRNAEKARLGFRATKDLVVRAKLCVDCHVGTPASNVNHDLIAAGHPRLSFELASYLGNLPKHWNARDDHARDPDFEARVWALGQVSSAQSALRLLQERAVAVAKVKERHESFASLSWPEFAEYDCFACHHDLAQQNWRIDRADQKRRPGTPSWASWYLPLPAAAITPIRVHRDETGDAIERLRSLMNQPVPPAAEVAALAEKAAIGLEDWLAGIQSQHYQSQWIRQQLERLVETARSRTPMNWDRATQQYLAIAALHRALGDLDLAARDPAWDSELDTVARALAFPPHVDSPTGLPPLPWPSRTAHPK
jgi:Cytochrome c554 and c-prime